MSQPLKIQLAIQGGGAKICSLLAAAEVIHDLETKREIQITRISGTSARAIGCLLATNLLL